MQRHPCIHPYQTVSRAGPAVRNSIVIPLPNASADTRLLVRAALFGLGKIYKPGYAYKKAGVMLIGTKMRKQPKVCYCWDMARSSDQRG